MVDPFTALSVATSIFQILEFTGSLLKRAHRIRKARDGALTELEELQESTTQLTKLSSNLHRDTSKLREDSNDLSEEQRESAQLAESCEALSDTVNDTLKELIPNGQQGRVKSLMLALKLERQKGKLRSFERDLANKQEAVRNLILRLLYTGNSEILTALNQYEHADAVLGTGIAKKLEETRNAVDQILENTQRSQSFASMKGIDILLRQMVSEALEIPSTQRILRSLTFDAMDHRRANIAIPFEDTYDWMFMSDHDLHKSKGIRTGFRNWLYSGGGIYWVSGKAGSGKSTLMKYVSSRKDTAWILGQWAGESKLVTASFWFWYYGTTMERTQIGLIRALLFEILRQCPDLTSVLCPNRWATDNVTNYGSEDWTLEELSETIDRLSSQNVVSNRSDVRFCFFIDGLDEYDGDHNEIIALLKKMSAGTNIKVVASSRPWNIFLTAFGQNRCQMLTLQELTFEDISKYTEGQLVRNTYFAEDSFGPVTLADIVHEVTTKAQGVFLWVHLVIKELRKSLQNGDSLPDIQRRLNRIPPDLEPYFERMLYSIEEFYRKQAAQIFLVCVRSRDPLYLDSVAELELGDPLAARFCSDHDMESADVSQLEKRLIRRINSRCLDLLEVKRMQNETLHRIEYFHRTVRDFLGTKDMLAMLAGWAGTDFDPLLLLCRMELLILKRLDTLLGARHEKILHQFRADLVRSVLLHCAQVEAEQLQTPNQVLDEVLMRSPQVVLENVWRRHRGGELADPFKYLDTLALQEQDQFAIHRLCDTNTMSINLKTRNKQNGILKERSAAGLLLTAVFIAYKESAGQSHLRILDIIELLVSNIGDPNVPIKGAQSLWICFLIMVYLFLGASTSSLTRSMLLSVAESLIKKGALPASEVQLVGDNIRVRMSEAELLSQAFGRNEAIKLISLRRQPLLTHAFAVVKLPWRCR